MEFSGVRNSWLMLEKKWLFNSEARCRKSALIVQLSIQSDHATIGFIQFAVELGQFVLASPQFLQGIEQFFVLLLEFFVRILRGAFDAGEDFIQFAGFEALEAARELSCRGLQWFPGEDWFQS